MEHISPTSSTDSQASIEIGDFIFCHHGREVCQVSVVRSSGCEGSSSKHSVLTTRPCRTALLTSGRTMLSPVGSLTCHPVRELAVLIRTASVQLASIPPASARQVAPCSTRSSGRNRGENSKLTTFIYASQSINVDFSLTKEGVPQCKKHRSTACTSCHSFKKQIAKLNKEASKSASKRKGSTSNFV